MLLEESLHAGRQPLPVHEQLLKLLGSVLLAGRERRLLLGDPLDVAHDLRQPEAGPVQMSQIGGIGALQEHVAAGHHRPDQVGAALDAVRDDGVVGGAEALGEALGEVPFGSRVELELRPARAVSTSGELFAAAPPQEKEVDPVHEALAQVEPDGLAPREALERLVGVSHDWGRLDEFLITYAVEPAMRATVAALARATWEAVADGTFVPDDAPA